MKVPPTGQEAWRDAIEAHLRDGAAVALAVIDSCQPVVVEAAAAIVRCLQAGGTVYFCGNGGSAADAQHLAAELVGRYLRDRHALAAVALTTDTAILTAVGNDHGFARVYERQVHALMRARDVLVALSTSRRSESVVRAVVAAKHVGATVIGMTGAADSPVAALAEIAIHVPSTATSFIQEAHIAIGHAICGVIEAAMTPAVTGVHHEHTGNSDAVRRSRWRRECARRGAQGSDGAGSSPGTENARPAEATP